MQQPAAFVRPLLADDQQYSPEVWNVLAEGWQKQVGDNGDINRIYASDPILWKFLGSVKDEVVLDAGCGTGYLSRELQRSGARLVIGVDFSPEMIKISERNQDELKEPGSAEYRVDSVTCLETVGSESVDAIVSNYVLMDAPDLEGAVSSIYRVLKPSGRAVIVLGHPCFDAAYYPTTEGLKMEWNFPYFDDVSIVESPWGIFKEAAPSANFYRFHRPLSKYWKVFRDAGFKVKDFDEPSPDFSRDIPPEIRQRLLKQRMRPNSVAFLLKKPQMKA
eukprot:TRINITY_DN1486_c0_g2_i1.p1 TRINITY_DN1486_c0_g2~~TRINITY_DN1486_c0_g2_i1.p1  ORF type:complete len:276 (+),score=55.11 TRINITY_DN1486_c0_g2_i1:158-985(+)